MALNFGEMQEESPAHEGITPPRRMSALDNAKGLSLDFVFINLNQHSITDLHCFGRMSAFIPFAKAIKRIEHYSHNLQTCLVIRNYAKIKNGLFA